MFEMHMQYTEKVLNTRRSWLQKNKCRPTTRLDGVQDNSVLNYGRGELGIAATKLLGCGESGTTATWLFGLGELGIAATRLLSAIFEIARLVPATIDNATTSVRKRFPVCVMSVSPLLLDCWLYGLSESTV
jgi:hypothetical protein